MQIETSDFFSVDDIYKYMDDDEKDEMLELLLANKRSEERIIIEKEESKILMDFRDAFVVGKSNDEITNKLKKILKERHML